MTIALDPTIDLLHQENWHFLKNVNFWWRAWLAQSTPADDPKTAHLLLAERVETYVRHLLETHGLTVQPTAANHPYDLLVSRPDGRAIRVEVKASFAYHNATLRCWRYQASIRNQQTDLVIFVCLDDFEQPHPFVIPQPVIGPRRHLTVTSLDPRDYAGQWAEFLNAWHHLYRAFAKARPVAQQQYLWSK